MPHDSAADDAFTSRYGWAGTGAGYCASGMRATALRGCGVFTMRDQIRCAASGHGFFAATRSTPSKFLRSRDWPLPTRI